MRTRTTYFGPNPFQRPITRRYEDPLDAIWRACARKLGFEIARSNDVFASYDGAGVLTIALPDAFDPDDSLAQMIFHELCHALVAGRAGRRREDWGLDNTSERDLVYEHACHRVQAALAGEFGLRAFFAVTTQWRPYWDALPADPLAADPADPAVALAVAGYEQARHGVWAEALAEALQKTAEIARIVRDASDDDSLWCATTPLHPLGSPLGPADQTCGTCAWRHAGGPGPKVPRCRQHRAPTGGPAPRVDEGWRACDRWEPPLDDASCASCGACCREAYHMVPVSPRAALVAARPDLVVTDAHGHHLPRPGGRCVALALPADGPPYRCSIYALRPRSCRDFDVGGDSCLWARRRVGLSRRPPATPSAGTGRGVSASARGGE